MLISFEKKFVFLCNSKCASTSTVAALEPHMNMKMWGRPQFKHIDYRTYKLISSGFKEAGLLSRDTVTVALMRDPLSWIRSWYTYRMRASLKGSDMYTGNVSFNDFILAYTMDQSRPKYAKLRTQCDFLCDEGQQPGVDVIFDLKRTDLFEQFVAERFQTNFSLPKLNKSKTRWKNLDYNLSQEAVSKLNSKLDCDLKLYEKVCAEGVFYNSDCSV
jgi:hypothetical protein